MILDRKHEHDALICWFIWCYSDCLSNIPILSPSSIQANCEHSNSQWYLKGVIRSFLIATRTNAPSQVCKVIDKRLSRQSFNRPKAQDGFTRNPSAVNEDAENGMTLGCNERHILLESKTRQGLSSFGRHPLGFTRTMIRSISLGWRVYG